MNLHIIGSASKTLCSVCTVNEYKMSNVHLLFTELLNGQLYIIIIDIIRTRDWIINCRHL